PQRAPSPQPVTSRQAFVHASQSFVLPSSHSSPGSRRPLPQVAPGGGGSTLTKLPRPGSVAFAGSVDAQDQTLFPVSDSLSPVQLPAVGSGTATKRSFSGVKRMSVSEFDPVTHTSPVRRLALSEYGVSEVPKPGAPGSSVGRSYTFQRSVAGS